MLFVSDSVHNEQNRLKLSVPQTSKTGQFIFWTKASNFGIPSRHSFEGSGADTHRTAPRAVQGAGRRQAEGQGHVLTDRSGANRRGAVAVVLKSSMNIDVFQVMPSPASSPKKTLMR